MKENNLKDKPNLEALEEKVEKLSKDTDIKLISQNQSLLDVLYNFYLYVIKSKNNNLAYKKAATKALIKILIFNRATIIVVGTSFAGYITLFLMYKNNLLVEEQNYQLQLQSFHQKISRRDQKLTNIYSKLHENNGLNENKIPIPIYNKAIRQKALDSYIHIAKNPIIDPTRTKEGFKAKNSFKNYLSGILNNDRKKNIEKKIKLVKTPLNLGGALLTELSLDLSKIEGIKANLDGAYLNRSVIRNGTFPNNGSTYKELDGEFSGDYSFGEGNMFSLSNLDMPKTTNLDNAIIQNVVFEKNGSRAFSFKGSRMENVHLLFFTFLYVNFQGASLYNVTVVGTMGKFDEYFSGAKLEKVLVLFLNPSKDENGSIFFKKQCYRINQTNEFISSNLHLINCSKALFSKHVKQIMNMSTLEIFEKDIK